MTSTNWVADKVLSYVTKLSRVFTKIGHLQLFTNAFKSSLNLVTVGLQETIRVDQRLGKFECDFIIFICGLKKKKTLKFVESQLQVTFYAIFTLKPVNESINFSKS